MMKVFLNKLWYRAFSQVTDTWVVSPVACAESAAVDRRCHGSSTGDYTSNCEPSWLQPGHDAPHRAVFIKGAGRNHSSCHSWRNICAGMLLL